MFESCSVSRAAARAKENQVESSLEVCLTGNHLKAADHTEKVAQTDLKGKGRAAKTSRSLEGDLRPANYRAELRQGTGAEQPDVGHRAARAQLFLSEELL